MSASSLTTAVTAELERIMAGDPSPARLAAALRHLAKWRAQVIGNTLAAGLGTTIPAGPFAGMSFPGGGSGDRRGQAHDAAQDQEGVEVGRDRTGQVGQGPAAEGGYPPRLLGAYEATLHPVIETIIARP